LKAIKKKKISFSDMENELKSKVLQDLPWVAQKQRLRSGWQGKLFTWHQYQRAKRKEGAAHGKGRQMVTGVMWSLLPLRAAGAILLGTLRVSELPTSGLSPEVGGS
jgi:hypothetical protein